MSFSKHFNDAISNKRELNYYGHGVWPLFKNTPEYFIGLGDLIRVDLRQSTRVSRTAAEIKSQTRNLGYSVETYPQPETLIKYGASFEFKDDVQVGVDGFKGGRKIEFSMENSFALEAAEIRIRQIANPESYADKLWDRFSRKDRPAVMDYLVYSIVEVREAYFMGNTSKSLSFEYNVEATVQGVTIEGSQGFSLSKEGLSVLSWPPADIEDDKRWAPIAVKLVRWGRMGRPKVGVRS